MRYTRRAEADLDGIGAYTLDRWGIEQCIRYLDALERACERLAQDPKLGRVHLPRPRYSRFEQGKHVLFFRRQADEVVIVRILHERMLPELHLTGEADE